ncbi:MAG: WxcM-like protein [Hydrocarboniphaga sp.]|uniref:sugar 3,4-ketoisomerase n=1 Tax=Hydrocarboniphaga sp. TaxID=2033016 RepID=UPI00262BCB88|nr:FdtA/QdtA family cupin domain-containing protein [Hydrocarboniphaga sp.]MDB5971546.1 WxcM-like protein [Hydrocarboniphaga sp.]
MATVDDCRLMDIRTVFDHRGTIAIVESELDVGFPIRRVYWTFDIPSQAVRAGHAHRALQQVYVAASGSFEVLLDDGERQSSIRLYRPDQGLLLVPGIWREISHFSSNACLLVIASELYDEADYIRDHADFLAGRTASR